MLNKEKKSFKMYVLFCFLISRVSSDMGTAWITEVKFVVYNYLHARSCDAGEAHFLASQVSFVNKPSIS